MVLSHTWLSAFANASDNAKLSEEEAEAVEMALARVLVLAPCAHSQARYILGQNRTQIGGSAEQLVRLSVTANSEVT